MIAEFPCVMTDLFKDKAADWDSRPIPARISEAVGHSILARVALRDDMRVMDFGAGTGLVCGWLAPRVGKIFAVDVSAAMLATLAAKPELQGKVETVCRDLLETNLDTTVALVVSAMAMHHVEHIDRMLEALCRHLEPDGQIALADLDAENGDFHPEGTTGVFHHGFDREDLRDRLEKAGFDQIEFETALELEKDDKPYSVFLVTARRR